MPLTSPEQLTQLVDGLVLTASEKLDLNRRMANRARQFFRQQIRAQRDIDNNPYQSRARRKANKLTNGRETRNTVNNKNMLLGFSKALRTQVSENRFEVGLKGVTGIIGREHNEGAQISFTTRVNGFYDSKTGNWKGGTASKRNYLMPKRTFIGWTPALERELLAMAAEYFVLQEAA